MRSAEPRSTNAFHSSPRISRAIAASTAGGIGSPCFRSEPRTRKVADSPPSVSKAQRQKIIGVGNFDQREFPVSLTNTIRDFNKATATTNTSQIGQYNVPVVLVIKKNSSTLKNLPEWLREHSVHQGTQMVGQPERLSARGRKGIRIVNRGHYHMIQILSPLV